MKRYHLLSLVLIVILVSILAACSGIVVTETVTLPTATKTATLSAPTKTIVQTHTTTITLSTEPTIPTHYSTYTSEGLFSISYPPDWEPALSVMEELESFAKELLLSIMSDAPVGKAGAVFFGGLPTDLGWSPNVGIMVESFPGQNWTHDGMVEAQIGTMQSYLANFTIHSQLKTTISEYEATIVDYEATVPTIGEFHYLGMVILDGDNVWVITCTSSLGEFNMWEDDFYDIVMSFRL